MAKALFKREGNESPSKRQMKTRIEDLKKTNPNIKDGELKGKKITANVAQEMESRIAGKEKNAKEYKQNLETRKQSENIAKSFYKIADDNSGYTSMKKMQELLDTQVTKDNITAVLDAYDKEKNGDSSIIDTVTSEIMPSGDRRTQKQVLRTIMSKLSDAARQAGVTEKDIEKANLDFEASIKREYDSMGGAFRRTNPKDMEKAVDFLRGAIVAKQTGNVQEMSDEDAIATFNSDFAANDADAQKQYADARKEEGWTAKVGDTVCGWFGCTTIDDMDKKLGKNAADVKKLAAAAGNETEFKKIYKEVFGIDFDKDKIAARDAALGNLQQAQNMSSTINITSGILKKSGSLDYSGLRDEVKTKFQFDDNTVDSVIQSYAQTIGKDASTDDAKKQMLMRFLEETQNNAAAEYQNLTKGKTIEQMNKDLDLLTKSAFGTNDIVKDVIQFNENQQTTEMITDAAFEIAGTIALQAVPGLGQMAAARLAVSAARWGTRAVKVINYATKAEKAFAAVNKFQKVNRARQIGTQMANAGIATASVEASTGKDAKTVMKKTLMNMSFAGVGAGSSMLAPKLMQSFGITNRALANEIAEEIMNAAGSYGVTKVAGDDYGTQDAFVDFATGLIMSRLSHVQTPGSKGAHTDVNAPKTGVETPAPNQVHTTEHSQTPVTDKKVTAGDELQSGAAGEKKAAQIKEEVQEVVTNPEPVPVKTKAEQHDDVLSMLQEKAQTGKGLSPDDFKQVSEYIETITDNAELKEISGLLGGKKMTSAQKKQLKEALAAKTEALKNSAPTAEPVKTETKKTDTPEVEEVKVPKENETPIVQEEVEVIEIEEPAPAPVEPAKGNSDIPESKIDETPTQQPSDVSVKVKEFKEMDSDELIAEYQRLKTEQDESVHIWKEYGEHSVLTPTIDNTLKTNEIENLLKERGLNTKGEKIQNKPREQVQEPVVQEEVEIIEIEEPATGSKVKPDEDLDALPEAEVEPENIEKPGKVINEEVPIVNVEPEPVRVKTNNNNNLPEKYNFENVKIATCRRGCSGQFDISVQWRNKGENIQIIHQDGKTYILEKNSGAGWRDGDFRGLEFEGEIPDDICKKFAEEIDWNNFDLGSKKSAIDKMNSIRAEGVQTKPKAEEAAVHYPTPEEKMAMGQIGENINRAKSSADIKKAQEWLNKMPECDQKARLQKQLNEKLGKLTPEVEVVNVERANDEPINVKKSDSTNEVQDAAKINQKRMEAQKAKLQSLEANFQQDIITVNIDGQNVKVVRFKGSQEGSNPGFWIKDTKTGELSYMKYSNNSSKMSSEALASDLYNLAGVSTPKLNVVRNSKGENIGITSKFMDLQNPSAKDIQNIKEGFAADCWLANWDALKDGNVMTQNGQAVRSDVGGSLCYRARGGRKGAAFGENVNELTSFFGSNSLSKKYIDGMSKDELINSLNKVTNINDDDIAKLVDKVAGKKYSVNFSHEGNIAGYQLYGGLNNPEYVKETLIARRNYMKKFQSLCEATPMRQGESIGDYVQRIQNIMPKKTYNISLGLEPAGQPKPSFENIRVSSRANLGLSAEEASSHFLAEHLTPSQKQMINNSCEAFRNSRGNRIRHNATNKLTTNDMLHATDVKYLDSILEKGLISREFSGESSAQINGVVQDSRTPMCADLWDVQNNMSINQYFHRSRNEWINGETNFLPNPHTEPRSGLVIVFNKNAVDPTIMNNSFKVSDGSSIMFKDGNMGGYDFYKSHRAVPVGIPSNAIDRVIVPSYGMSQLGRIKAIINKSGLDIKIYDTNGNLL